MIMFSAENVNIITSNNNWQGFILFENFQDKFDDYIYIQNLKKN